MTKKRIVTMILCICMIIPILFLGIDKSSAEYVAPQPEESNTFNVTWLDVVYAYPSYLNNNDAAIQEAAVLQLCQDIFDDYSGWDTFWSSLEYSLKNAGNIKKLITSFTDAMGWTSEIHDKAADKAVLLIMKSIYEDPQSDFWQKTISKTSSSIRVFSNALSRLDLAYEALNLSEADEQDLDTIQSVLKELCEATIQYNTETDSGVFLGEISKPALEQVTTGMVDYYKDVCSNAQEALKIAKLYASILFMQNIEQELVDYLLQLPLQSEILASLKRLRTDIRTNFASYFIREYLESKAIDKIYSTVSSELFGKPDTAAKLAQIGCSIAGWLIFDKIFEHTDPEELLTYMYLCSFAYSMKLTLEDKIDYISTNPITSVDVADFEFFYPIYSIAMKTALSYSKKLADSDSRKDEINTALMLFDSSKTRNAFTLQGLQQFCIDYVSAIPEEDRVLRVPDSSKKYTVGVKNLIVCEEEPGSGYDKWIYPGAGHIFYGISVPGQMLSSTGNFYIDSPIRFSDLTLHGGISISGGGLYIKEGISLYATGGCSVSQYIYTDDTGLLNVAKNASLTVAGNVSLSTWGNKNANITVRGTMTVLGKMTTSAKLYNYGLLRLAGDMEMDSPSGSGILEICGDTMQTNKKAISVPNLIITNTSSEGVVTEKNITVTQCLDNQRTPVSGTIVLNGGSAYIVGPKYQGSITIENALLKEDVFISGSVSKSNGIIIIPDGNHTIIGGNLSLSRWYLNDNCGLTIKEGGKLTINGNFSANGWDTSRNSTFYNYGVMDVSGSFTVTDSVGYANTGTLILRGTVTLPKYASTPHTIILKGSEPQTVSCEKFYNLVIENTSETGVSFSKATNIYGCFICEDSVVQGEKNIKIQSGATVGGDRCNASIVLFGTVSFSKSIVLQKNLYMNDGGSSNTINISNGAHVRVNGNARFYAGGGSGSYPGTISSYLNITDESIFEVHGNLYLSGSEWIYISNNYHYMRLVNKGTLRVCGNFTSGAKYTSLTQNGEVIFAGDKDQTVNGPSSFSTVLIEKDQGTVSFANAISVKTLFNHNQNPFTLYNEGAGSTFVDYDGDGLKDNVDPYPTIGNPCTVTLLSEDLQKGTVSYVSTGSRGTETGESISTIGGTKISVSATPTFKYSFSKWVDNTGKVCSNSSVYTFVAKADTTLTAVFTKRKQPITTISEGGRIVAPSSAEIESSVVVSVTENSGFIYEEGSLCYNGIPTVEGSFEMPDEPVVLSATFTRNENYFALKEVLDTAKAITYEAYSPDSFAALQTTIEAAEGALINHITEADSQTQIAALQSAMDGLQERTAVSVAVKSVPTIYVGIEDTINSMVITVTYDNGYTENATDWTISGFDCNQLGEQEITVTWSELETTHTVTVKQRLMSKVTISEIPDQVYKADGTEFQPEPELTYTATGDVLVFGIDYDAVYTNNVEIGTATITLTGKGNYSGTRTKTFKIYCEHDPVVVPAVAPTCTETGLTEGSYCSICNATLTAQTTAAATGHNYVDGVCRNCGDQLERYTVTYVVPDEIGEVESISLWEGESTLLPTAGTFPGYKFLGWAEEEIVKGINIPSYQTGTITPEESKTFYALYQYFISEDSSGALYKKVTDERDDWSGNYLIACLSPTDAETAIVCDGGMETTKLTFLTMPMVGEFLAPENGEEFEFKAAKVNSGYTIQMPNGSYFYGTSSSAVYNTTSVETAASHQMNITPDGISSTAAGRYLSYNNNSSGFVRFYANTSSYPKMCLYECVNGTRYFTTEPVPCTHETWKEKIVAPTCTEDGYTVHTCTFCRETYQDTPVPALGHTVVQQSAVEATCVESGLTAGSYCSTCNTVFVAQETVPALGHAFEDHYCTRCDTEETVDGSCGNSANWILYLGQKKLIVSGEGDMFDYDDYVNTPWYEWREELEIIQIEEGITSIGDWAFTETGICEIELPSALNSIGEYAFSASKLTRLTIPGSVQAVGLGAFDDNPYLEEVVFEDGCTDLGLQSFWNDSSLRRVVIPSTLSSSSMLDNPFVGCTSLEQIVCADDGSCRNYGDALFSFEKGALICYPAQADERELFVVTDAQHGIIDNILCWAFSDNQYVETVYLDANISSISQGAFSGSGVTRIIITNPKCSIYQSADTLGQAGGTTIVGFAGSTTESYANKYGYTFEAIGKECEQESHVYQTTNPIEPTCTLGGYAVHMCSLCYRSYSELLPKTDHVLAYMPIDELQHTVQCSTCDYSLTEAHCFDANGICACGMRESGIISDPSLKIKFASLTLKSDLAINFYVTNDVLAQYSEPYVVFTKALYDAQGNVTGYAETTVTEHPLTGNAGDGTPCQGFPFTGVNAKEIGSAVTATLYGTKDGLLCKGPTVDYSAKTYAMNQLDRTNDAELKTLLVDMLNYGTLAQTYWDYNTTNPANGDLTAAQQAYATQDDPVLTSCRELIRNDGATVSFKSASLSLRERVTINFYLNLSNYTGELSDLEAHITYTDTNGIEKTVVIDSADFVQKQHTDGNTFNVVEFSGLNACQMRTACTCEIFSKNSGQRVSNTVIYSIESYAQIMSASSDQPLVSLIYAMMKYGDATAAYFE